MFRRTVLIPGLMCLGLMALGHCAVGDEAIAEGTKVVTVRATPIKTGEAVVTEAAAGRIFTVREVRGNWLLVTIDDAGRTSKGFLYAPHASSLTDAIARLMEQIDHGGGRAETYFDVGLFRYHLGQWDEAITALSEAIRLRSDWALAHAMRGRAWHEKGDCDRAIPDYDRAIELDGSVPSYHIDRGLAGLGKGDLDKALTDFTEAIRLAPDDPAAYVLRGDAWRLKRKFDKAIVDLDRAFRLRVGYAPAFYGRGLVYYDQGKYRQAIADFGAAIDQDPTNADGYVGRGGAWYAIREFERTIADWKDAQRLRTKPFSLHLELGNACWAQGDCGQAIVAYTAAIQADQTSVPAYRNRANCYEMAGESSKAEADRVTANVVESRLLVGASLRLTPAEFVALLRDQLENRELVLIRALQPLSGREVILHLTEYSPDSANRSLQPSRIWQTRLAPGDQWAALAESLVSTASSLREAGAWVVELPGLGRSRYVELRYDSPRQSQLAFPGLPNVVLSEEAQRHLELGQLSSLPGDS